MIRVVSMGVIWLQTAQLRREFHCVADPAEEDEDEWKA